MPSKKSKKLNVPDAKIQKGAGGAGKSAGRLGFNSDKAKKVTDGNYTSRQED